MIFVQPMLANSGIMDTARLRSDITYRDFIMGKMPDQEEGWDSAFSCL